MEKKVTFNQIEENNVKFLCNDLLPYNKCFCHCFYVNKRNSDVKRLKDESVVIFMNCKVVLVILGKINI